MAEKTITVEQVGSPIRREASQRQTLIGLGLNKRHRTSVLSDTPSTRGMIHKVRHLVKVLDNDAQAKTATGSPASAKPKTAKTGDDNQRDKS